MIDSCGITSAFQLHRLCSIKWQNSVCELWPGKEVVMV